MISDSLIQVNNIWLTVLLWTENVTPYCGWIEYQLPQVLFANVLCFPVGVFGVNSHQDWAIPTLNQLCVENQYWECVDVRDPVLDSYPERNWETWQSFCNWNEQSQNLKNINICWELSNEMSQKAISTSPTENFCSSPKGCLSNCVKQLNFQGRFDGHEGKLVGFYTQNERIFKIRCLQKRLMKRKFRSPISKVYKGRSNAARVKQRLHGKFIKSGNDWDYHQDQLKRKEINRLIDKYVTEMDYNKIVDAISEY